MNTQMMKNFILVTIIHLLAVSCSIFEKSPDKTNIPQSCEISQKAAILLQSTNSDQILKIVKSGWSVDSLKNVSFAVGDSKFVYIGSVDSENLGVFVHDIARDSMLGFWSVSILPSRHAVIVDDSLLLIGNSDYVTGSLSLVNLKSKTVVSKDYKSVHQDHDFSFQDGKVFLLERTIGVVTGFVGGILNAEVTFLNKNLGENSNPYAVRVSGNKAFVATYGLSSLTVLNNFCVEEVASSQIDLSSYSETVQMIPYQSYLAIHNNELFVVIQRRKGVFGSGTEPDTSKIVVIDADLDIVKSVIDLKHTNPIHVTQQGEKLYVSSTTYTAVGGGLELVNLNTKTTDIIKREENLGGYMKGYYPLTSKSGFALVGNTSTYEVTIKRINF